MNRLPLFSALASLVLVSCSSQPSTTIKSIYADPDCWYDNGKAVDPALADVFYILPTCVHDWTDSIGTEHYLASRTDPEQRRRMLPSYQLADDIFADSANFFAPYYSQVTLESWTESDEVLEARFSIAMSDIREAFDYYLRHQNQGRPFVLAGFSQGGKCVVELVKSMEPETYSRMVAAYVCGYRVTEQDVARSSHLRPALKSDDTGVTIVYNTVSDTLGITPRLSEGNVWISNPASWTQDEEFHRLNDEVSIRIDQQHKVLIADGIDAEQQFIPQYAELFPLGCLHLLELTLYHDQLQRNVKQRIASMK